MNQAKSSTRLTWLENQMVNFESEKRQIDDIIHRSLEEMAKYGQQSEIGARLAYKRTELKRKQDSRDEKYVFTSGEGIEEI